jgi:Domain of unknown function (DUF6484)
MKQERNVESLPATETETEEREDEAEELDLLELVATADEERGLREKSPRPERIDGVVIGRLVAWTGSSPRVSHRYAASEHGDAARFAVAMTAEDVGREVALLFEGGSPERPIVMGFIHGSVPVRLAGAEAEADGERLVFNAEKEIVLRCGDASITLTRAGKILIRGTYVSSRASNVNRIQGGSVEIN